MTRYEDNSHFQYGCHLHYIVSKTISTTREIMY